MAQNKFALARYQLIHRTLLKNDYVKTLHLQQICKQVLEYPVSIRTIQLDIETMKNDSFLGFYAPIEYCKKRKAYYYYDHSFQLFPFRLTQQEIQVLIHVERYIEGKIEEDVLEQYKLIILKIRTVLDFNEMTQ